MVGVTFPVAALKIGIHRWSVLLCFRRGAVCAERVPGAADIGGRRLSGGGRAIISYLRMNMN